MAWIFSNFPSVFSLRAIVVDAKGQVDDMAAPKDESPESCLLSNAQGSDIHDTSEELRKGARHSDNA